MADFEEAGDDDVFRKVRKDFDAKGVARSDHQIRRTMDELMAQAVDADQSRLRLNGGPSRHDRWQRSPAFRSPGACARAKPSIPAGAALPAPMVAEIVAREGFSAVTLDQQHGLWDIAATRGRDRRRRARAAPRRSCACRCGDFAVVSRVLDFGAEGIIAPMINTAADARAFVGGGQIPAARRAQLGAAPRHDARPASPTRRTISRNGQ